MERMLDEADNYLRSVAALPAFDGLKVMTTVRTGEARQEIIASAKEISADVIAMTTHGERASSACIFYRQILHALEEATRHGGRPLPHRDRGLAACKLGGLL
jgi:hypothetical protein